MPTYAYRCADCGHAFDVYQSFSDDALTACPECGGKLRKVFGSLGVTFNGSGFYRTDSRSAAAGTSGGSAAGSPSGSGASSGSSAPSGSGGTAA